MSATHNTSGASARKRRSTRSSATRTPGTRIVVRPRLRATTPDRPAWRMRRCTRLRETTTPSPSLSSAVTRRDP